MSRERNGLFKSMTTANFLQLGSGLSDLASGFASLAASSAEARQYKIQTIFDDLAISNQKLKAQENAIFLREKFLKDVSSARASFAGRNVAIGSGIGARFEVEAERILQEDLKANELNSRGVQNTLEVSKNQSELAEKTARNLGLIRSTSGFKTGTKSLLTAFKTIKS